MRERISPSAGATAGIAGPAARSTGHSLSSKERLDISSAWRRIRE